MLLLSSKKPSSWPFKKPMLRRLHSSKRRSVLFVLTKISSCRKTTRNLRKWLNFIRCQLHITNNSEILKTPSLVSKKLKLCTSSFTQSTIRESSKLGEKQPPFYSRAKDSSRLSMNSWKWSTCKRKFSGKILSRLPGLSSYWEPSTFHCKCPTPERI